MLSHQVLLYFVTFESTPDRGRIGAGAFTANRPMRLSYAGARHCAGDRWSDDFERQFSNLAEPKTLPCEKALEFWDKGEW